MNDPIRPWPKGQMLPALKRELDALQDQGDMLASLVWRNQFRMSDEARDQAAMRLRSLARKCTAISSFIKQREGRA